MANMAVRRHVHDSFPGQEAVGIPWREQMDVGLENLGSELLERGDIIQNPESAPVGPYDQVVEMPLNDEIMDWCMGKIVLQWHPGFTVVHGDIHGILRPEKEQPLPHRIFPHAMGITEYAFGNAGTDHFPAFSIVCSLVDIGIAVVDLMEIHRDIAGRGIVPGGLDVAHCSPGRQIRDVVGNISPVRAAIPTDMGQAVVGAGPDQSFLKR